MWFCFLKWFNVFMKMDFLAFDYRFLPNRSVDKIKNEFSKLINNIFQVLQDVTF